VVRLLTEKEMSKLAIIWMTREEKMPYVVENREEGTKMGKI